MINKIIFSTLRDNKGATGGPGGVLYMLKETIGNQIDDHIKCKYEFNYLSKNIKGKNKINKLIFLAKSLLRKNAYYVVHDIESAYLLALFGKKYSLVYHNQGPLVQERLNFNGKLSVSDINVIKQKEKLAFIKANSLHFPSLGAEKMYFDNEYRSCSSSEVKLGVPLYNTIPSSEIQSVPNLKSDDKVLTFFSLGTLTLAKGQDLVVPFLTEFIRKFQIPIRYVLVGNGPLKKQLIEELNNIQNNNPLFQYHYFEKLSHSEVMYLHTISDIYIMFHRLSIFDFATLEAMNSSSAIILSNVGGNLDFDKENNIIYMDGDYTSMIEKLKNIDINALKIKNKSVFERYFSQVAFKKQYIKLINDLIVSI